MTIDYKLMLERGKLYRIRWIMHMVWKKARKWSRWENSRSGTSWRMQRLHWSYIAIGRWNLTATNI